MVLESPTLPLSQWKLAPGEALSYLRTLFWSAPNEKPHEKMLKNNWKLVQNLAVTKWLFAGNTVSSRKFVRWIIDPPSTKVTVVKMMNNRTVLVCYSTGTESIGSVCDLSVPERNLKDTDIIRLSSVFIKIFFKVAYLFHTTSLLLSDRLELNHHSYPIHHLSRQGTQRQWSHHPDRIEWIC